MISISVGNAKIRFETEGCTVCGTKWSSGWYASKTIAVQVGSRHFDLDVHICADCVGRMPQDVQLSLVA